MKGGVAEDDNVFRSLLRQRNSSIPDHGFKPMSETFNPRFLEYADMMMDPSEVGTTMAHARLREPQSAT